MQNVPSTLPSCDIMGVDQTARSPFCIATCLYFSHLGSEAMSETMTRCFKSTAVPHDPTLGPMRTPSVAARYASGRFGAATYRKCNPSSSSRKIEHNIPSLWASIIRMRLVRTSFKDARMSITFNASSTASLGRVCARDGDVGSAFRLDDALAFAINQRPVSRDASSIAQTDVQHFAGEDGMRNSRASLACRNDMEHVRIGGTKRNRARRHGDPGLHCRR